MNVTSPTAPRSPQCPGGPRAALTGKPPRLALMLAISAVVFVLVLLVLNRDLFSVPIHAYGDSAPNALQVERAKHFRESLGHYSRWGFNHPGPALFYVYAAGERVFHDWLRLVPAEMNAHVLTVILLNAAFLFGAMGVVARHFRTRLFPPAAVLTSLFFIACINRAIPGSAILSVWPPHAILFCFVFFMACCASLACGRAEPLPWLVASGLMLLHAHVAQACFVGPLALGALATFAWRHGRALGARALLRQNRTRLAVCAALVILFALPIALDVVRRGDNNLRAILHHASLHPGQQQPFVSALRFGLTFLAFIPDPEVVLASPSASLIAAGASSPFVLTSWYLFVALTATATVLRLRAREKLPPFTVCAASAVALVAVSFLGWTLKTTGPLFNFNGYFFFSVELFCLWALLAFVLDRLRLDVRPAVATGLCALLPISVLAVPQPFLNARRGDPQVDLLVENLPPNDGSVYHLTFAPADWKTMAAVAARMKHAREPFCVDDLWAFPFGRDNVCRKLEGMKNLVLAGTPAPCSSPCRVLAKNARVELDVEPYPMVRLPFTLKPDDRSSFNQGFNEGLGTEGPVWTRGRATIAFHLAPDFTQARRVRVRILGSANEGRPARFLLNGTIIGTAVPGRAVAELDVDATWFVPGENHLEIQVDHPLEVTGDPQNNPRVLGFSFLAAELEALSP